MSSTTSQITVEEIVEASIQQINGLVLQPAQEPGRAMWIDNLRDVGTTRRSSLARWCAGNLGREVVTLQFNLIAGSVMRLTELWTPGRRRLAEVASSRVTFENADGMRSSRLFGATTVLASTDDAILVITPNGDRSVDGTRHPVYQIFMYKVAS